jgi:hypothetical protein
MKPTLILLAALMLALFGQAAEIQPLQDKTLVVWAAPANQGFREAQTNRMWEP